MYNVLYRKDGSKLSPYLRAVAEELNRVSDILDEKVDDMIGFYDETESKISFDYKDNRVNGS